MYVFEAYGCKKHSLGCKDSELKVYPKKRLYFQKKTDLKK